MSAGARRRRPAAPAALELALLAAALAADDAGCWPRLPGLVFRDLARFQALFAAAFAFYALALLPHARYEDLPLVGAGGVRDGLGGAHRVARRSAHRSPTTSTATCGRAACSPTAGTRTVPARSPGARRAARPGRVAARQSPGARHDLPAARRWRASRWWRGSRHRWRAMKAVGGAPRPGAGARAPGGGAARAGASAAWVAAYAWNPLVLVEYAGTGHNDPTAMLWLVLALLLARTTARGIGARVFRGRAHQARAARSRCRSCGGAGRAGAVACVAVAGGGLALLWGSHARGVTPGSAPTGDRWRNNELVFHLPRALGRQVRARARGIAVLLVVAAIAWGFAALMDAEDGARAATPHRAAHRAGAASVVPRLGADVRAARAVLAVAAAFADRAPRATAALRTPAEARELPPPLAWRLVEYGVPLAHRADARGCGAARRGRDAMFGTAGRRSARAGLAARGARSRRCARSRASTASSRARATTRPPRGCADGCAAIGLEPAVERGPGRRPHARSSASSCPRAGSARAPRATLVDGDRARAAVRLRREPAVADPAQRAARAAASRIVALEDGSEARALRRAATCAARSCSRGGPVHRVHQLAVRRARRGGPAVRRPPAGAAGARPASTTPTRSPTPRSGGTATSRAAGASW